MTKPGLIAGLSLAVTVLAGCAPAHQDLRDWMAQERRNARPHVTPIKEPKPFVPAVYDDGGLAGAFALQRLTSVLRGDADAEVDAGGDASLALINPELNRRREPLEEFPLDAMSMVGLLERGNHRVALVRVNGLLYQVTEGNHIGQDYGLVTNISESEITLREIVQDAAGEWIERKASLELQESTK